MYFLTCMLLTCCGIWLIHFYDTALWNKLLQYKVCKISQGIGQIDEAYSFKSCHNTQVRCHICIVWIVDIGRYRLGGESRVTQTLLVPESFLVIRARQCFRFGPVCRVIVLCVGNRMNKEQPIRCHLLWIQTFLFTVMGFISYVYTRDIYSRSSEPRHWR